MHFVEAKGILSSKKNKERNGEQGNMLRRGNVKKRAINIAMVLILLCVITGCKGNASVSENGKISKKQTLFYLEIL